MRVWVTRSEPGASRLVEALESAGFEALAAPVLDIEPVAFQPPAGHFDLALFVSAAAARLAATLLRRCFDQAYAVGQATAAELALCGVQAIIARTESSEGLLAELPAVAGKRILLVAGIGGRDTLPRALAARQAEVARLAVYRRAPITPIIDPSLLDCLVVSSGDGFRQAAQVWLAAAGPRDAPVLTPSKRVADMAQAIGMTNVTQTAGASPEAVLAGLNSLAQKHE